VSSLHQSKVSHHPRFHPGTSQLLDELIEDIKAAIFSPITYHPYVRLLNELNTVEYLLLTS
jgi:hypothetical protein